MLSTGVVDVYKFEDTDISTSYVEHCSPYSTPSVSTPLPSSPTLSLNFDRDQLVL